MITSGDIKNLKFEKATVFGYRTEDVDNFLGRLAEDLAELERDNEQLEEKMFVLAETVENYRAQEESLKTTLLAAQRLADSLVEDAKKKAEAIIAEAAQKAEAEYNEAHDRAQAVIRKAEQDEKILASELAVEREKALKALRSDFEKESNALLRMQKEVSSFKNNLLETYKHHLSLITALPEIEVEEEEEVVEETTQEVNEIANEETADEAIEETAEDAAEDLDDAVANSLFEDEDEAEEDESIDEIEDESEESEEDIEDSDDDFEDEEDDDDDDDESTSQGSLFDNLRFEEID